MSNYIKSLELPHRGNCPKCGGIYTFSASIIDGNIVYYCFRASCKLKGRIRNELSIDSIIGNYINRDISKVEDTFTILSHWSNPLQNYRCLEFLRNNNLIDLYSSRSCEIYYDPKLDRCVFPLRNYRKELKGATGRSLAFWNNPKWYIYNRIHSCPFIQYIHGVGDRVCIIVEDVISAIHASSIYSSIGLLGTNISEELLDYLQIYDRLFIALDADATSKSIELQKKLSTIKPTFIIPLIKDIKYYDKGELEELNEKISKIG